MNEPGLQRADDHLAPGAHRTLGAFLVICCIPIAHLPGRLGSYFANLGEAIRWPEHLRTFGGDMLLLMSNYWVEVALRLLLAALFFLYVFWISRSFRRVVIFNACVSVFLTLAISLSIWAFSVQYEILHEALRKR